MDVDLLKASGGKYSSTIYVDSAKRNRMFYPSPNNYEVVFSEPFRNVFSVQVLDASIPRTHYNVDTHNNSLCYQQFGVDRVAYVDVGDYTDNELLDAINSKLNGIAMEFLSSPSERRKQFCFVSESPFVVYPFRSTLRETLGFDEGNASVTNSRDDPANYEHTTLSTTGGGSAVVGVDMRITSASLVLYQRFVATEYGAVSRLVLGLSLNESQDLTSALNHFDMSVRIVRVENASLVTVAKSVVPSDALSQEVTDWTRYEDLQTAESYYLVLNVTNASSVVDYNAKVDVVSGIPGDVQLYTQSGASMSAFDESRLTRVNEYTHDGGESIEQRYLGITSDDVGISMGLVMQLTISKKRWSVTPPGIYNLLGDRYIILRCKEIENHVMSTIKSFNTFNAETDSMEEKQYETGIAKFKMSVVGFREERFDFNILPPQEFHPIGKLTSLTFSFQNQDGKPYDFKGVNHTITLAINHYKPVKTQHGPVVAAEEQPSSTRFAELRTDFVVSRDIYDPEK